MENLRKYDDDELSLRVFNDEFLYTMRHKKCLIRILREYFIFSKKQLEVLKQDLADDREESLQWGKA